MSYVMPFILGMVVTMVWLPVLTRLANRWLIVDRPGARKVHTVPIPRVGGVAMAFGVLVAVLLAVPLHPADRWFLAAAGILIVFGVADDRFDLDYRLKLLGQILAVALVVFGGGIRIHSIALDERVLLADWISLPLTILFLVGVTNAVNLADGLDGLAGGTTFLSLCAVALLSSIDGPGTSTALALAFAGAVLGFLRFNTYPASVFMGDAGSQLLGFGIGVLCIRATQNAATEISAAIPLLLLALPILDTLSVMVQRISEGRSPFSADKNHIHHKLLALGFDHHEAVMVIYAAQALLFLAAYFLRYESDILIVAIVVSLFALAIGALQLASRAGWRFRQPRRLGSATIPWHLKMLREPRLVARITNEILAASIASYAGIVLIKTARLSADFRVLVLLLLAVTVGCVVLLRSRPLNLIDKGALYVTATLLVYLDEVLTEPSALSVLAWVVIAAAGVATAVRIRISNDRRFELTPLDLIVLFMALVVPSLSGALRLPFGALGIAKLVVLYYAIEMLVSRTEQRAVWVRMAGLAVLAGLVIRPLAAP